jgi:hypothetical protein
MFVSRFGQYADSGSCAEVQKLGILDIGEKLKGRAQLVSCVHDEIIIEFAGRGRGNHGRSPGDQGDAIGTDI